MGGLLVFLGCLGALAGLLATAAPMIDNDQVRLILASFSVKTPDGILTAVNQAILFCLSNHYALFAAGACTLLLGGLMKTAAAKALYLRENASRANLHPRTDAGINRHAPHMAGEGATSGRESAVPTDAGIAASRTPAGPSPYAAAMYEKPAAASVVGTRGKDITAKYRPRSIINTPSGVSEVPLHPKRRGADVMSADPTRDNAELFARPLSAAPAEHPDEPVSAPVRTCVACGAAQPSGAQFCGQCGTRLADTPQGAVSAQPLPLRRVRDVAAENPETSLVRQGVSESVSPSEATDAGEVPRHAKNPSRFMAESPVRRTVDQSDVWESVPRALTAVPETDGLSTGPSRPDVKVQPGSTPRAAAMQRTLDESLGRGETLLPGEGTMRSDIGMYTPDSVPDWNAETRRPSAQPWRDTSESPVNRALSEAAVPPKKAKPRIVTTMASANVSEEEQNYRVTATDSLSTDIPSVELVADSKESHAGTQSPTEAVLQPRIEDEQQNAPAPAVARPRIVSTMGKRSDR